MAINRSQGIKNSEQNVLNWTFDEDFGVLAVELLAYDPVAEVVRRVTIDALSHYGTNDVDSNVDGHIYEGLENSDGGWQIVQTTTVGTITSNRFATQKNNPTITTYTDAWTARTSTLIFDTYKEAF
jgi:hypothetical protein